MYINYDRFSPDAWNRKSAWEGGAVVVAHEIAHYFSLLHTFEGGCAPTNDAVTDTPRNLSPDAGWQAGWIIELNQWCRDFRTGKNPDAKWLLKIKSCPNAGGPRVIDNVFNLESYLDDECRMAFTPNQVRLAAPVARSLQARMPALTPLPPHCAAAGCAHAVGRPHVPPVAARQVRQGALRRGLSGAASWPREF